MATLDERRRNTLDESLEIARHTAITMNDATNWAKLGQLLQSLYFNDTYLVEAVASFRKALICLEKEPQIDNQLEANIHQRIGMLLKQLGEGEQALDAHENAFRLFRDPSKQAFSLFHKGTTLQMLNRLQEAVKCFQSALALNTGAFFVYHPLAESLIEIEQKSKMATIGEDPEFFEQMIVQRRTLTLQMAELLTATENPAAFPSSFFFGFHSLLHQEKEYVKAWQILELAHKQKISECQEPYDPNEAIRRQSSIIKIFVPKFWPDGAGISSTVPVFIVGMMRSGSTLFEHMLDAHSQMAGIGENSVLNSNLPTVRDDIIRTMADVDCSGGALLEVIKGHAERIVAGTEYLNLYLNSSFRVVR